ncbi:hypothetical protein CWB60_13525 [Pseudoalteromonas sp. S327]|uniref:hypothetical protein n=1 Tax=Pseudoalteromonas TaxID=53246 RepID=UPI00110AEE70|nr:MULTISPECIES: hypothetical protein [unclassified Pseudoalteromonas]TMO05295.1 hypothetical protein CWB60_13525 [Pseudoalteromonas sp. S327]TMO17652.1 hypothetical protein CWB59_10090 [Pseudoalteromonas sp. S326]
MFRVLFLLPILLCFLWFLFLRHYGVPIKQGKKGFLYILAFSAFILGFFVLIMQFTHYSPIEF